MNDEFKLVTTRVIDAPVDRVWAAWRDPVKIARWWGPAGFHSTVRALDFREGGRLEIVMHGPDGTDYRNTYIFDEIADGRQLVFTNVGSEEFGLAAFQSVFVTESMDGRTRVTLTAYYASAEDERKHIEDFQARQGSEQLLQRLEEQARDSALSGTNKLRT